MLCKQSQLAETEPVHLTFLLELRENGKYVKKKKTIIQVLLKGHRFTMINL